MIESDNKLISWLENISALCGVSLGESGSQPCRNGAYYFLPDRQQAKFLLPLGNGFRGYRNGLELYPAIYPKLMAKKMMSQLVWVAAQVNWKNRLVMSHHQCGSAAKALYELFTGNVAGVDRVAGFAVRSGSAGAGFKLIFQFQDETGNPISYIKVGDPVHRGPYLLNEYRVLNYLEQYNSVFVVPRVAGIVEHSHFTALELTPAGKTKYFPRPDVTVVARLLATLCQVTDCENHPGMTPASIQQLEEIDVDNRIKDMVKKAYERLPRHSLPRPLTHSDLGGWNVFIGPEGKLGILDWEFAQQHHLPFLDLYHYFLHTIIHNSRRIPIEAYRYTFYKNRKVRQAINTYGTQIGVTDEPLQQDLRIAYLWDWYYNEQTRAENKTEQAKEYLAILTWLSEHEYRN